MCNCINICVGTHAKKDQMKRQINKKVEAQFTSSNLWTSKIKNDCLQQKNFLAIRDNRVDIYHKGGKLFTFDTNGFKTHIKYAAVITSKGHDYLTQNQLALHKLGLNFKTNYLRIKENCANYSGIEAAGVSEIYRRHSYLSDSDVVVLDIEVSFQSQNTAKKQDRIDILLLNKKSKELQFVEAKHFTNKEIWSTKIPDVVNQISRYEGQIRLRKKQILSEYTSFITTINRLFGVALPNPINIDPKVTLLIFGFDNDQKKGRLNKLIIKNHYYSGIKCYSIGNVKSIKTENLWNAKIL